MWRKWREEIFGQQDRSKLSLSTETTIWYSTLKQEARLVSWSTMIAPPASINNIDYPINGHSRYHGLTGKERLGSLIPSKQALAFASSCYHHFHPIILVQTRPYSLPPTTPPGRNTVPPSTLPPPPSMLTNQILTYIYPLHPTLPP